MSEHRSRFLPEGLRFKRSALVDVREGWHQAPELPFAYRTRGNVITWRSLRDWRREIQAAFRNPPVPRDLSERYAECPSRSEMRRQYHRLRFLSRPDAEAGLLKIAQDIRDNFDPRETLIYIKPGSSELMYRMIGNQLQDYGTVSWSRKEGGVIFLRRTDTNERHRGAFQGDDPKTAEKWLYIDDWVLTGGQLLDRFDGLSIDQLFTYHLVMSDQGKALYDRYGIDGKTVYRLTGDDGPDAGFTHSYPVYGFHKVPDCLSGVYADDGRGDRSHWTIFPNIRGMGVRSNSRLIRY